MTSWDEIRQEINRKDLESAKKFLDYLKNRKDANEDHIQDEIKATQEEIERLQCSLGANEE